MTKSKQILTALRLPKIRLVVGALMWRGVTKFMLISFILLIGTALAGEKKVPSGTVEINETQFALIIGGSVGGGTLRFKVLL